MWRQGPTDSGGISEWTRAQLMGRDGHNGTNGVHHCQHLHHSSFSGTNVGKTDGQTVDHERSHEIMEFVSEM